MPLWRAADIDCDPNANNVTLTWSKTGAPSYIAKFSNDLSNRGSGLSDGFTASDDENTADPDHITVTFELPGSQEKLFFRMEEE